jgi:hypothetical protein
LRHREELQSAKIPTIEINILDGENGALSHRWLMSRQAADFESRGSSAGRAFTLI